MSSSHSQQPRRNSWSSRCSNKCNRDRVLWCLSKFSNQDLKFKFFSKNFNSKPRFLSNCHPLSVILCFTNRTVHMTRKPKSSSQIRPYSIRKYRDSNSLHSLSKSWRADSLLNMKSTRLLWVIWSKRIRIWSNSKLDLWLENSSRISRVRWRSFRKT
jgi:hypothetical protein